MKILILSPLFPPDTGAPASYVKDLAERLAGEYDTTLLVYGYLPENVTGASISTVDKRALLPLRLLSYTKSLLQQSDHNLVIVNNAPSIELPLLLVSLFKKNVYILIESDPIALKASKRGWYKVLHKIVQDRSKKIVVLAEETNYKKAEILPFVEFDAASEARRQTWWSTHLNHLLS